MDLKEIENTIEELEKGPTTFANCAKLADLYIVWEHLCDEDEEEEKEREKTIHL